MRLSGAEGKPISVQSESIALLKIPEQSLTPIDCSPLRFLTSATALSNVSISFQIGSENVFAMQLACDHFNLLILSLHALKNTNEISKSFRGII